MLHEMQSFYFFSCNPLASAGCVAPTISFCQTPLEPILQGCRHNINSLASYSRVVSSVVLSIKISPIASAATSASQPTSAVNLDLLLLPFVRAAEEKLKPKPKLLPLPIHLNFSLSLFVFYPVIHLPAFDYQFLPFAAPQSAQYILPTVTRRKASQSTTENTTGLSPGTSPWILTRCQNITSYGGHSCCGPGFDPNGASETDIKD